MRAVIFSCAVVIAVAGYAGLEAAIRTWHLKRWERLRKRGMI